MKKKSWLVLFVLLIICSIPSLWKKISLEQSSNYIEFSIDYLSLLSLSEQSEDPNIYLDAMLMKLKEEGFTTLTLPNNTFASLEERGLVSVLSSDELGSIQLLSNHLTPFDRHLTYILVLDRTLDEELMHVMNTRFSSQHIEFLTINKHLVVGIDMPFNQLSTASIPYLEKDLAFLTKKPYDFSLVLKLDNQWQGNEGVAVTQINQMPSGKISSIYFADSGVLGFPLHHQDTIDKLPSVPFAYKEYFTPEEKQKGIEWLAPYSQYQMIRLHSIPYGLFETNLRSPDVLVERITKGVTERNMRLFHLQFPWEIEGMSGKQIFTASFAILKESKEKLLEKGFVMGTSEPFHANTSWVFVVSQWCAALAGLALMVFAVNKVYPKWTTFSFVGLSVLFISSFWLELSWQVLALGIAVVIPLLGVLLILDRMQFINEQKATSIMRSIGWFIVVSFVSLLGGLLLSSMHSELPYVLYIEGFRGVALMHIVPPVLTLWMLLVYDKHLNKQLVRQMAFAPVQIYQLVLFLLVAMLGAYYVSRTGNGGILLPFEAEFRSTLENLFGVRPRTKEFLLGHPLLLLVLYYWHQHKWIKWTLPIAIIGQLSMVNTFTHFHTPVWISLQRGLYGMALGMVIGLVIIGLIEGVKWVLKKKALHH